MTLPITTPGKHSPDSRRIAQRFAPVALLATAALATAAGTAHAESNESIRVSGGKVSFIGHGNGLAAWDTKKDGRCMVARVKYLDYWSSFPDAGWVYERAAVCGVGKGNLRRLKIPEGVTVHLYACYAKKGRPAGYDRPCSNTQKAES